ncbi:hypothetical protein AB434_3900 [Heyndrickxia coagulans]|uniref:Uncharacterized protein n=1 Tax=Heyndrickxia coagulans TaxID=1398 RepID=A0AAN0T3L8_HEYCO|nr:hypothetical protein SB48_HM08orf02142 [Heyndrickxia coagulans]AKN56305.1 hypothetical protein AB434_3900 [Heyndrickxia coagulans]
MNRPCDKTVSRKKRSLLGQNGSISKLGKRKSQANITAKNPTGTTDM